MTCKGEGTGELKLGVEQRSRSRQTLTVLTWPPQAAPSPPGLPVWIRPQVPGDDREVQASQQGGLGFAVVSSSERQRVLLEQ